MSVSFSLKQTLQYMYYLFYSIITNLVIFISSSIESTTLFLRLSYPHIIRVEIYEIFYLIIMTMTFVHKSLSNKLELPKLTHDPIFSTYRYPVEIYTKTFSGGTVKTIKS